MIVRSGAFGLRDFGGEGQSPRSSSAAQLLRSQLSFRPISKPTRLPEKPLSRSIRNSNLPLSVAVVKKVMKGLAAIAREPFGAESSWRGSA